MYAVEVRDHIMIAHSLAGEVFGPAQQVHGATFVIDVAFFRSALSEHDIVVDIGLAHEALKRTLGPLNYQNLDNVAAFKGKRSTTEALAKYIFDQFAGDIAAGRLGEDAKGIERLRVTLNESHVARGWYEAALPKG